MDQSATSNMFVDLYSPLDFMVKLHTGMAAGLSHAELEAQFAANVRLFERLAGQMVSTVIAAHADRMGDEVVAQQIQKWQMEPFLADLLAIYQEEDKVNPIDSSWITLGQQRKQETQEVVR